MLSDEVIDKVVERLVNRIEQGNEYILQKIGENIKKFKNVKPSEAQKLYQIIRYGGDYDKIVKRLSEITELNVKDIYAIFNEVAKTDYLFAKQFYEYRSKKYIPYEKNVFLKNQVEALASITAKKYIDLAKTMAFAERKNGKVVYTELSKKYNEILDEAILNVGQGKETFDSAMYRSIKRLGASGIRTVDYESGRSMRLDSAVRMQMKGALAELHEELSTQFGKEYKADGKEISVHENPAPDHAEVQGHQFYIKEFEKFQNDKDCKDVNNVLFPATFNGKDRRSIGQYNCYHYTFNIVVGVSKPIYTPEQLQNIINDNNKGFEFEGEKYTMYEGTQLQRRLELEIRKQKDLQIIAKASDNEDLKTDIANAQNNITTLTKKYRELCEVSGLKPMMERMRVSGYKRVAKSKLK